MSLENEKHVRKAYQVAEEKDIEAFIGCFTDDGTFTDQSIGVTYRQAQWPSISTWRRCCRATARPAEQVTRITIAGPAPVAPRTSGVPAGSGI